VKKNGKLAAAISFVYMLMFPVLVYAQSFQGLCNAYNQYFGAKSQLIGFGLSIMIIVSLVAYFTSEEKRGIISIAAGILIVAGVVMIFPQILAAVGITTC
jgi:hypothetical protein